MYIYNFDEKCKRVHKKGELTYKTAQSLRTEQKNITEHRKGAGKCVQNILQIFLYSSNSIFTKPVNVF